jgi:hypothetical protein
MHAVLPGDYLTLHSVAKSNLPPEKKTGIMRMFEQMRGGDTALATASRDQIIVKASKPTVAIGSGLLGIILGAIDAHVGLDVDVKGVKVPVDGVLGLAALLGSSEMGAYEDHARIGGALGLFSAGFRKGGEWSGGKKVAATSSTTTTAAAGDENDPIARAAADL